MPAYLKQPTQSLQIRRTDSEDAAVRPAAAPERHAAPSVPTGDRRRAFRHSVRLRIFRSGNFAVSAPLFPRPRRREVTACGGTFPDIATSVIGIAPVSGSASPHDRPRTVAHGLMHPRSGTFVYFLTDIFSPAQGRRPCTAPGPTNTASNLHPARRKHRLTPLFSHLVRKQHQPCTRPDENTGFAPIVHIDRSPNSFCSASGRTQTPAYAVVFSPRPQPELPRPRDGFFENVEKRPTRARSGHVGPIAIYQLAFFTPGIRPFEAISRNWIRLMPNRRM